MKQVGGAPANSAPSRFAPAAKVIARKGGGRVTAQLVANNGGIASLIAQLVKDANEGDQETKETAAGMLSSLASQNHGEHLDALFVAGAIPPLVRILTIGSAKAMGSAAAALHALANGKPKHQAAIISCGAVVPLVKLLKTGSAKVQEEVCFSAQRTAREYDQVASSNGCVHPVLHPPSAQIECTSASSAILLQASSALAAIEADVSHQKHIISAGGIDPLIAVLKGGSAAAQAFSAQALANAAAYNAADGQDAIVRGGAVPILLALLNVGKAQTPAAMALANVASQNPANQLAIAHAGGIAPLLALLNGRNMEAQVQAASALSELARDNAETQAAIAKAGGIRPLLALLASRSFAAQSKGMFALAQLSRNNSDNQDAVAKMGGMRPLVQLLDSAGNFDPNVQAHAAFAIMEICGSNYSNQQLVVENGGIAQLSSLLQTAQQLDVKAEVAGALWALSEDPAIKTSIAAPPTVKALVTLLGNGNTRAHNHAAEAVASLALNNEDNQVLITEMLIDLLSTGTSENAQERAATALWALVDANPNAHDTIAMAGDPAALVDLLISGIPRGKDYALWSLSLSICEDNQKVVADAGGVQPLIDQLEDSRASSQEQAAAALAKLAHNNGDMQAAITSQGGVAPIIKLLGIINQQEQVLVSAASALANLAVEPAARDEIVAAGGIHPLVLLLKGQMRSAKNSSATALARLSKDHEATQAAIAEAGAIVPLVSLLDGSEGPEAQEEAAGALFALAEHERNRLAITESDGIAPLVSLLACDNPKARGHAEGALVRLSMEVANRTLIILKLVDMVNSEADGQERAIAGQEQAAAALANLARESEDNRNSIVGADGIPPLLALLDSQNSKAKENAVSAITALCRNSLPNQAAIAKVGGIPKLVNVLLGFTTTTKESALIQLCTLSAAAVKEMVKGNKKNQDTVFSAGAIPPLVAMLGSPSAQMQANAAGALANLARNHPDNQTAIARTGAIAPLCQMVREGSQEAKDRSASAIWSLATDNAANKDTLAKLGGIDPLLGLLVAGTTERSQENVSGALCAVAAKHTENRALVAKRLVGLLGSAAAKAADRAVRVLQTCSAFANDSTFNQIALAKAGIIPPLIIWLTSIALNAQAQAAHSLLCVAVDNTTTQSLIAKAHAIPPLIGLLKKSSPAAQDSALRALWHLASQPENQVHIADAGGVKPLVGILSAEGELPELAAITMVRLMRGSPDSFSLNIADKGGIPPLVSLLKPDVGTPAAQQQACAALTELALVDKIRDQIANTGGIKLAVDLLGSSIVGTPEIAARLMEHLSLSDDVDGREALTLARSTPALRDGGGTDRTALSTDRSTALVTDRTAQSSDRSIPPEAGKKGRDALNVRGSTAQGPDGRRKPSDVFGSDGRRAMIQTGGGLTSLIAMLDGSNQAGKEKINIKWSLPIESSSVGVFEQAAATIAEIAFNNPDMQDSIIDAGGVPCLLSTVRTGSPLGQEHAASAIRNLAGELENQSALVDCGAIPDLVQLTKIGSQRAQEVAAAGLSELASGAIADKEAKAKKAQSNDGTLESTDRLILIADAGGITPLVTMTSSHNSMARENAAGALMHLALDPANQVAIAKANGIAPLVTILDEGTAIAHEHAAEAIARLAVGNEENQAQSAKHLVALLGTGGEGAQKRAAHVMSKLAKHNAGSPVIMVNAGAISPLVTLLSIGNLEVKHEAASALSNLSLHSPSTQLAIATALVGLIGVGSAEAQEHVAKLLLTLATDAENRAAIAKAGAIPQLVVQLRGAGNSSAKAQKLAAAVLSHLSGASENNVDAIATAGAIKPLVALLSSEAAHAEAYAAAVLADLAQRSTKNKGAVLAEGGIMPLVALLHKDKFATKTRAEGAHALRCLSTEQPETQRAVADAGAFKPLVVLLDEDDDYARRRAAGAIAALSAGSQDNQDIVAKYNGIGKLVELLSPSLSDEVRGEAAATLAILARNNKHNQDKVTAEDGIGPLVALLRAENAQQEQQAAQAAATLWSLAAMHYENQVAIADGGGIAPLVAVLGMNDEAQEQAAGALAALALDNDENVSSIAKLVVSLLGSADSSVATKAAHAISRLAMETSTNQAAFSKAGGVELLVTFLDRDIGVAPLPLPLSVTTPHNDTQPGEGTPEPIREARTSKERGEGGAAPRRATNKLHGAVQAVMISTNLVASSAQRDEAFLKEMASAIWSLANNNADNQAAIAQAGAIPRLIMLLHHGSPELHREVAGALWGLAGNPGNTVNQKAIADALGIEPLVQQLKANLKRNERGEMAIVPGTLGAQETAAGALHALAELSSNRILVAKTGGIPKLVALLDEGTEGCKDQAAGALEALVIDNPANQKEIALGLVEMLSSGSASGQEMVTQVLRNLAKDPENRRHAPPYPTCLR